MAAASCFSSPVIREISPGRSSYPQGWVVVMADHWNKLKSTSCQATTARPLDHRTARRALRHRHLRDPLLREPRPRDRRRARPGNQRRYPRSTLRRLGFIRAAQRVGLSLDEIAEALATLPAERTPTKRDWQRLSRHWRGRIEEQIDRLERLRDRLDSCIGCGCLSLRTCALSNPGDVAAEGSRAGEPGAVTH